MKFSEATELHRKSGVWGTRGSWRVGGFENQQTKSLRSLLLVGRGRSLGFAYRFRPSDFLRMLNTRGSVAVRFPSTFVMARYFCRRLFMTMASMAPAGVT
jgi:hypothetical protein